MDAFIPTHMELRSVLRYIYFICVAYSYRFFFPPLHWCTSQVKVMVRICPAKGEQDTSESMSFLKVDAHKKQLTFCEPPTSAAGQRRFSSTMAPKIFNFDAVFTQDASQVCLCSSQQYFT